MSRLRRRVPVGAEVQPDGTAHIRVWAPFDTEPPSPRAAAFAQAWSIAEVLRGWMITEPGSQS